VANAVQLTIFLLRLEIRGLSGMKRQTGRMNHCQLRTSRVGSAGRTPVS